jgi:hypothetical protein
LQNPASYEDLSAYYEYNEVVASYTGSYSDFFSDLKIECKNGNIYLANADA